MLKLLFIRKYTKVCFGNAKLFLSTQTNIEVILKKHLNIDHNVANLKCSEIKKISLIPREKLIANCTLLREFNVNTHNVWYLSQCLILRRSALKTRILLLREMGVKDIGLHHISRFSIWMHVTVKTFKIAYGISLKENIIINIFNNIGLKFNEEHIPKLRDNMPMVKFYTFWMTYFKLNYLQLEMKGYYESSTTRYQSFQEILSLADLYRNRLGLDNAFLAQHQTLLYADKDHIEDFIAECKDIEICGKGLTEIIRECPHILNYKPKYIKELLIICNRLNLSSHSIRDYMFAFKLKDEFLNAYVVLTNNYELKIWSKHSLFFKLIGYYNKVRNRLEHLRFRKLIDIADPYVYLTTRDRFESYLQHGRKYSSRKFVIHVLEEKLGKICNWRQELLKIPGIKWVPPLNIVQTIDYLKDHYSTEDISRNIHIVFYPKSVIAKTLEVVRKDYLLNGEHFTPSQQLALCVYFIEKEYQFKRDSIWFELYQQVPENLNVEDAETVECKNFVRQVANIDDDVLQKNGVAWLKYLLRQ